MTPKSFVVCRLLGGTGRPPCVHPDRNRPAALLRAPLAWHRAANADGGIAPLA